MHDQAENLRRRVQVEKSGKNAKTLSVISGKGGVGKSNVALNFCLQLTRHHKKVLLFDMDFGMGNVDILMGLHAKKTIIDMFHEHLPVQEVIEKGPLGLSYIAGGSGLHSLFKADKEILAYFFEQYNELIKIYDYIIFDMGAGATEDSIHIAVASDECIVVTTPEPTSITDAYGMVKYVLSHSPSMPVHVVMNRVQSAKAGKEALLRFKKVVLQFLHTEIQPMGMLPEDKNVAASVMNQTPFLLYKGNTPIAKAMEQLTKGYIYNMPDTDKDKTSFIRKLKQLIER